MQDGLKLRPWQPRDSKRPHLQGCGVRWLLKWGAVSMRLLFLAKRAKESEYTTRVALHFFRSGAPQLFAYGAPLLHARPSPRDFLSRGYALDDVH